MAPTEACAPVVLSPAIISVVSNGNAKMHAQGSGMGTPLEPGPHFDLPEFAYFFIHYVSMSYHCRTHHAVLRSSRIRHQTAIIEVRP